MSIIEDFPAFYQNELEPRIREENERIRKSRAFGKKWFWIGLTLFFGGFFLLKILPWYIGCAVIAAGVIFWGMGMCGASTAREGVRDVVCRTVIPMILAKLDDQLEFPGKEPENLVKDFHICPFHKAARRVSAFGWIAGYYHGVRLSCAAIDAEGSVDSEDSDDKENIFKGSIIRIDCNKNYQGRAWIYGKTPPEQPEEPRIKMENSEFQSFFRVYSADELETRYLLSPALMERMVNLRSKLGTYHAKLGKSRTETLFFLVIEDIQIIPRQAMEYPQTCDEKFLRELYVKIVHLVEIIDDLDLSTRIWTKE